MNNQEMDFIHVPRDIEKNYTVCPYCVREVFFDTSYQMVTSGQYEGMVAHKACIADRFSAQAIEEEFEAWLKRS